MIVRLPDERMFVAKCENMNISWILSKEVYQPQEYTLTHYTLTQVGEVLRWPPGARV